MVLARCLQYDSAISLVRYIDAKTKHTGGSPAQKGSPPPRVVLNSQLKVGERNGDEGCHYEQDDEDDEQDGIDRVHFVTPHAGKDVVQLNVYSTEWQEPCKHIT